MMYTFWLQGVFSELSKVSLILQDRSKIVGQMEEILRRTNSALEMHKER